MYKTIVFLILCAGLASAQKSNTSGIIQRGVEASYQFQFEQADSLFYSAIELYPNSPLGYHYLSQLHLWYYLGSRDEAELMIYQRYSELAQEKVEILLKKKVSAGLHFLSGQIYLFRALAEVFQDKRISALFSSRNAKSEFEETLEQDSTFYDAYYGIGVQNYVLSFVPSGFQWVISLSGLDADKEEGLNNLLKAFRKGKLMKTEAAFHLAQIYSDYAAEYDSSLFLLNKLTEQFPNNLIFNYEKAVVLIKAQQLTAAKELLLRFSSSDYKEFSQTKALIFFQLGNVYFLQNRFNEALIYYDKFFKTTNSLDFTGIAHYRMAICYFFINEKLKSKHELLMAGQGNLDLPQDEFAKNQSHELFDSWLDKENQLLILANNHLRAGNFSAVLGLLSDFLDKFENQDSKNKARIYIAEAYIELDSVKQALSILQKIDTGEIEPESWVIPYSYLLYAKYYSLKSNYIKADEFLELAEDNNRYDYKEEISAKIIYLKRKLTRHLKIDANEN